jgi:hypothetical protein
MKLILIGGDCDSSFNTHNSNGEFSCTDHVGTASSSRCMMRLLDGEEEYRVLVTEDIIGANRLFFNGTLAVRVKSSLLPIQCWAAKQLNAGFLLVQIFEKGGGALAQTVRFRPDCESLLATALVSTSSSHCDELRNLWCIRGEISFVRVRTSKHDSFFYLVR